MSRQSIADTLKSKRKETGLSVEAVCSRLKVYGIELSTKSLYNYETAFRQPDADTLMALCEIYGISGILETFGYQNKIHSTQNAPSPEKPSHLIKNLDETEKSPATDVTATRDVGEKVTVDQVTALLEKMGFVQSGQDLSDKDLAFLISIGNIVSAWFDKTE